MSPWGYKSPRFTPLLFFHLSASLVFLLFLPPSSPLIFFCGEAVDCLWPQSGELKGSAVKSSSSKIPLDFPSSPPSRLAWASLLSLFTSRLSLRLSGHVFRLSARPHASCFVLLLSLPSWLSIPLSLFGSDSCCSDRDPALTSSKNNNQYNKLKEAIC